jgi:hypothetical protein
MLIVTIACTVFLKYTQIIQFSKMCSTVHLTDKNTPRGFQDNR